MDFHPLRKIHPVREIGNVFPGMDAQGLTVKQDLLLRLLSAGR